MNITSLWEDSIILPATLPPEINFRKWRRECPGEYVSFLVAPVDSPLFFYALQSIERERMALTGVSFTPQLSPREVCQNFLAGKMMVVVGPRF